MLETAGFDVCPDARDGVEAIELAREHDPTRSARPAEAPTTGRLAQPRLVAVAIELADIDEALAFYGGCRLDAARRSAAMAFVDMGDQFIALSRGRTQPADAHRHFGLVVDDKESTRRALEQANAEILPGRGLDFRDPWGNLVQIVQYDEIQFTKTDAVLRGMELELGKSERALAESRAKGIEPDA